MRLTLALLLTPLFVMTAHADEIKLECRAYGEMEAFAQKHAKFSHDMCNSTGSDMFCDGAAERDKEVQRCLATGQNYSHTQYITFDDNNLAGPAKKWVKPCWSDETEAKELKIAVSPDLTMSFIGETGSTFNVNMRTRKGGYLTDRNHTCEIINLSETGAKPQKSAPTHSAAEQGDANAQFSLGQIYSVGKGVPKDSFEAVKWYRKAAAQGHAKAQYRLGYLYSNGEGAPKNNVEALKWIRKSAEQGYDVAQYNLGITYAHGTDYPKDDTEAVKWYRKAAEQGHPGAHYKMGYMYYEGRGVPEDLSEALKWFRKAADKGDATAKNTLKILGQ